MIGENVELERQYRKNLMIVSMIVLIYSIAGGSFGNDLSFSGAKLIFSRPQWIEVFMLVVMGFLQWRHWLISGDIRQHHRNEVLNGLYLPSKHVRHFKSAFNPDVTFEGVDNNGYAIIKCDAGVGRVKVEIMDVCFRFILIKIVGATSTHGTGELSYLGITNNASRDNGSPYRFTDGERRVIRARFNNDGYGFLSIRYNDVVPFVLLNGAYRARWINLSFNEVWFGDSLLPAFVTGSAFICYCLSKFFS
ncbi:hypothetical protein NRZ31_04750 [Aeromonas dhakensis]|uniref:hypothetical protein n=1 Tax=Aeromonas dhakensis TaxID=196024 RepID=UPI00227C7D0C|nr:hypothetical protein [Aeromonas dhakensis]WAG00082.1 hypothetical protein NRZ31_04750 [Aeromonas dhakensis]